VAAVGHDESHRCVFQLRAHDSGRLRRAWRLAEHGQRQHCAGHKRAASGELDGAASFQLRAEPQGTSYINPLYAKQLSHARAAGVVVGHYHFQHHGAAAAEFAYFAAHADVRAGDIIALDWEKAGDTTADKDAWLHAARAHFPHNRVILYTFTSMWKNVDTTSYVADGLWIADPSAAAGHPNVQHSWVFHQYSTAGGIDHSVANASVFKDATALRAWTHALEPAKQPEPTKGGAVTPKVLSEAQQIASEYNDIMKILSLDGEGTHAAGFFLAHARHDAKVAADRAAVINDNVLALTAKVDALAALIAVQHG